MARIFSRVARDEVDLLLEQSEFMALPDAQRDLYVACTSSAADRKAKAQSSAIPIKHFDDPFLDAEIKEHTRTTTTPSCETKLIQQSFDFPKATYRQVNLSPMGRKSIFALEMEQKLRTKCRDSAAAVSDAIEAARPEENEGLKYLLTAGSKVISGAGLGFRCSEVKRIHQENINRLSEMSEADILREREILLSSMDPSTISFFLHKDRKIACSSGNCHHANEATVAVDSGSNSLTSKTHDPSKYPILPSPNIPHMNELEPDKLEWTLELPAVAKTAPGVHMVPKVSSDDDDIEMIDSLRDLPSRTSISVESKPCQARFDLSGLLVHPDAVVDTHLGLHHHGDEPERAGYTVGELFHLSRSSVPAQRRLALATLSASLITSRRGLHVLGLAPPSSPSLIHGLLSSSLRTEGLTGNDGIGGGDDDGAGVVFLLRWCLDESVAAVTRVGAVAAGVGHPDSVATGIAGGASLSLTVECIRCFANLLSDSFGEALLSDSFDWAFRMTTFRHLSIAPSNNMPNKFVSRSQNESDSQEEDINHSKVASRDPVHFLFTHSHLGQRLCWLLSGEHGEAKIKLSADAVGVWLPALLMRAVRHSPELAYRVFIIPNLFKTLMSHFLPKCSEDASSPKGSLADNAVDRPNKLVESFGIPFPAVLQLCRITLETSGSIRLAMVNDLQIIERCISYLVPCNLGSQTTDPDTTTPNSLVAHLPQCLPLKLALKLQIESLHCLSSCLSHTKESVGSVPSHVAIILWNSFPSLLTAYERAWTIYSHAFLIGVPKCPQPVSDSSLLLLPLLSSWNRFACCALSVFVKLPSYPPCNPVGNWSPNIVLTWLHQFLKFLFNLLAHIQLVFRSHLESLVDTEMPLIYSGVTPNLLSVAIDSTIQLHTAFSQLVVHPKPVHTLNWMDLYNTHLLPLFSQELLLRHLQHFIHFGSVLTGQPGSIYDVDLVTVPPSSDFSSAAPPKKHSCSALKTSFNWYDMPMRTPIDSGLLEPVNLGTRCLPDWGSRVCFRYLSSGSDLACLFWPRTGLRAEDESDTLSSSSTNPHCLSLLSALVSALEALLIDWHAHMVVTVPEKLLSPVIDWITRFALKRPLPWLRTGVDTSNAMPHLLVAFEAELLGRALLMSAKLVAQQCPLSSALTQRLCLHTKGNLLYIAAIRLLPFLRGGQLWLLDSLLSDILSSSVQIDFVLRQDCSLKVFASSHSTTDLCNIVQMVRHHLVSDLTNESTPLNSFPYKTGIAMNTEPRAPTNLNVCSSTQKYPKHNLPRESVVGTLVPYDWAYLPIVYHYEASQRRLASGDGELSVGEQEHRLEELMGNLNWLLFLTNLQADLHPSDPVGLLDPLSHLSHLCIGWLSYSGAGSLGFGKVGLISAKLLHSIGPISVLQRRAVGVCSLEHLERLPRSFTSFYDIYAKLLEHYAALSYSAPVFSNLILWPCQQLCHVKYRRALWGEHRSALVAARLRLDQLLLPIQSFLEPEETDESILCMYASALLSGSVRKDRHPVLFLIAVHHLNRCLYRQTNETKYVTERISSLLGAMRHPGKSQISSKTIQLNELFDVLCRYKQPDEKWTGHNPMLMPHDKLHVAVEDSMVVVDDGFTRIPEVRDSVELLPETGMQLYSLTSLPVHRKTHWEKYFSR
ncbi:unnamed protein product [Dicrocoelium dendriticum]|nr:unnamed protein product [Dicrocoelium dendriticum]